MQTGHLQATSQKLLLTGSKKLQEKYQVRMSFSETRFVKAICLE